MSVLTGCRLPAGSRFAGSRFVKRLVGDAVESDSNANPRTRGPRTRDQVSASPGLRIVPDFTSQTRRFRSISRLRPGRSALLEDVARRAVDYLPGRARTPCLTFSAEAVAASNNWIPISGVAGSTSRCDRSAGPCWLAGDHDHRGRALLPRFVNGGALPASVAGSWLAAAWDQNVALRVMSPAGAVSRRCAQWVREILEFRRNRARPLSPVRPWRTSRHWPLHDCALLANAGWDVERDGLFGAPPLTVVVGNEVHVSLLKALDGTGA